MKREEVIAKLESFGAEQITENTWGFAGHVFQVYKKDDGTYDLREL